MWMQIECSGGYRVRGLQQEKGGGWRIMSWPEGRDNPERVYLVKDGVFYKPSLDRVPSHTQWQKASFGSVDNDVEDGEKDAVLKLIRKWDAQISPGSTREQEPSR